jgi:hypothetical protein
MKKIFTRTSLGLAALALSAQLTGCGDSENFVFTTAQAQAPIPIPVPPIAVNDTVAALGNATLNQLVANGVLSNDTLNGGAIDSFDATSAQGATVALNADGSFTYSPVFGFSGADTFTYTLANADGDSTATVTVNVNNQGFFVNNQAAAGGNGSQANPFNNLADALAAAGSGDTIYVFRGDGTPYATNFNLNDGVSLIGEGNGLVAAQQIEPAGQQPELQGTLTLLGNNTVSGFLFTGTSDAIEGNGASNLTITNNTIQTVDQEQIELFEIGGTLTITDNNFQTGDDDNSVDLENHSVNLTAIITGNTFGLLASGGQNGDDCVDLEFYGTSVATVTLNGNTVTGNGIDTGPTNIESGFVIDAEDTVQLDVIANNNMFDGLNDDCLDVNYASDSTGTVEMAGNVAQNLDDYLLDLSGRESSIFTATVTGNTVSSNDTICTAIRASDSSTCNAAVRDNDFTTTGSQSVLFNGLTAPTLCLDITGNTLNGGNLALVGNGNTVFNVERFDAGTGGPLDAAGVNTLVGGSVTTNLSDSAVINARAAGFCNIP